MPTRRPRRGAGAGRVRAVFLPSNRVVESKKGANLLDLAAEAAIDMHNPCNGAGTCGKCKIQLLEGDVSPITKEESNLLSPSEIAHGFRLACRTDILSDVAARAVGEIDGSRVRILEDGFEFERLACNPVIEKAYVELEKPLLDENLPDIERVERQVRKKFAPTAKLRVLRSLPYVLRDSGFRVTIVHAGEEIIGVEAGDTTGESYGVAVDIGTTTVVASLIDITTGAEVATASAINPQGRHGQDVLSRIGHAESSRGLKKLHQLIVGKIGELIAEVCRRSSIDPTSIYEAVVAGNAAMVHLFLGVAPTSLGVSPYTPVFAEGVTVGAGDIGLAISDWGQVHAMPSVSSYVGADIVAGIIATDLHHSKEPALLVDIGTNGEIVFGSRDGLVACSCAAGPALEGMNIACGTIAADGAVEAVSIDGDVEITTIGGGPPTGICGSGIIDAVAELIRSDTVDRSGRLRTVEDLLAAGGRPSVAGHIRTDGEVKFALTDDGGGIFISQKDIRQVQLAKGAISSGIGVLLKEVGASTDDIGKVFVAGAFGQHLRVESLARVGLIPQELTKKVTFVGNSSKTGAALCLLSRDKRAEAEVVAAKTKYFELSIYPGYDRLFVESLVFPSTGEAAAISIAAESGREEEKT